MIKIAFITTKEAPRKIRTVWTTSSSPRTLTVTAENSYLVEIKPLLQLLRIFGRFPYLFEKNGTFTFKIISVPAAYTIIFFFLQAGWTIYSLRTIYGLKIAATTSYDETLYWLSVGIFLVQNFIVPFTNWIEAPKIVKYISLWKSFQDDFCCEGLKLTMRLQIKILSFLVVPNIVLLLSTECFLLTDMSIIIFFPYISAIGGTYIFILFWVLTFHEIRNMARELSQKIVTEGLEEISCRRLLWLKLSSLSTSLGDLCGKTGLSTLTILFVTFVLSSYGLLAFFFDHSVTNKSFWGLVISTSLCIIMMFFICDAAHRTTQVVGGDFSEKLLQLNLSSSPQINNEVVLFLQTMAANPPNICFHGFVTVSRALFVSFISNTVTYLVVLLQFKASSMSTAVVNATKHA